MHRAGWNSNDFDRETMEMMWSDSCLDSKGGTGGFRYKCSQDGYAFVSSGDKTCAPCYTKNMPLATNVGPTHHQTDIDNAYLMVICHQNQKNKANVKATNRITTD